MEFVFIDDDKATVAQWLEWADRKGYDASHAESVFEADKIRADFYVFDISVVAPITSPHMAYSPIAKLAENHPGAVIVIVSGISKGCVEDVIDDVFEACGVRPVYGGWGKHTDFEKAIEPYL